MSGMAWIGRLFLELLQVALGNREVLSEMPSANDWAALYDEAGRQAVVGVLLDGLERLPAGQLPPLDLKLQWIGTAQLLEQTALVHQERARELTRRFKAGGFCSCVLKGVGLAQLYPNPLRRQCGDIDLWVGRRSCGVRSQERKSKERRELMAWLRSRYETGEVRWHHADVRIFDDVATEIHFHATWLFNPRHNRRLQKWLDTNGLPLAEATREGFNVPPLRFDVVYALVHAFHHLLESGIGLRHVVDYCYILRSREMRSRESGDRNTDYEDLRDTLRSLGLEKIAGAMMWVLQEACGMKREYMLFEPDEAEGRFLLSEIMAGGNFGQSRSDGLSRNTLKRYRVMLRHYPSEVLWMIPWKVWHRIWKMRLSY